jgi:hypothetical protein
MKYRPERFDGTPDPETAALLEVMNRPNGWLIRGSDGRWQPYRVD